MKKVASHYLYLPGHGFLKQQVVEVEKGGEINRIFPLLDEIASVEWLPGVIIISSDTSMDEILFDKNIVLDEVPDSFLGDIAGKRIIFFRAYPFDFVKMKPTSDTRFSECRRITW